MLNKFGEKSKMSKICSETDSEVELNKEEQGDTEIDLKNPDHACHAVDSLDSTIGSSYSLCGLTQKSTITSETLLSELSVHKVKRIERYAYEAGDDRYKSKSKSKSKENPSTDSVDPASKKEADAIALREEAISETLTTIKKLH
ncbi:unnamed protein product [Rhizophagus irregularis]|nr:unnamed protein product [Rhizophagus irregularis]